MNRATATIPPFFGVSVMIGNSKAAKIFTVTLRTKEKITQNTKLIIAQHTYGYPCDMDSIMKIAESNGISVIEDCCLA